MTEEQKDRYQELKDKALETFMSRADFDYTDWLDEKESLEYRELNNLFMDEYSSNSIHGRNVNI